MSDTTTTQPGTSAPAPKRPRKKHPVLRVVVGLAALGLIGGIAVGAAGSSTPAASTARPATSAPAQPATKAPAPPATSAPATPKWQSQGAACSPEGAKGKDYTGNPLNCQGGMWTNPEPSSPPDTAPADTVPAEPAGTVSQQQALESAQSYLDMGGFSKAKLIDQLSSPYGEKFSKADAQWAVAHCDADWNAQAVMSAKSYMEMGGFSRSKLIDQLTSPYGEQFTYAQAIYAVNHVGL
jgi:Host cell surface-exposed lipoprotein